MPTRQPHDKNTVIPRIVTEDVEGLASFLVSVFGAEGEVTPGRPAEMRIGDSIVMVSDGGDIRNAMPAMLYIYVDDVEEAFARAVEAGVETIEAPVDMFYGDRRATVKDRWGNIWQIAEFLGLAPG